MIKLRVGQEKESPLHGADGNNVEAPVTDESGDQERNISRKGDKDAQQQADRQGHADSADARATAGGASGHRSGAPGRARGEEDADASARRTSTAGRRAEQGREPLKQDKEIHHGMNLDDEAKERQTDEGGPVNSGARRGDVDAPVVNRGGPLRHRHGGSTGVRHHR